MRRAETDPYEVLGVARDASPDEIRRAYLSLVERYHPDHHDENPLRDLAEQRLAQVNAAYELLSDPRQRARYDAGALDSARASGVGPAQDPVRVWIRRAAFLALGVLLLPLLLRAAFALLRLLAKSGPVGIVLGAVAVVWIAAVWLRRRRARGRGGQGRPGRDGDSSYLH